MGLPQIPKKSDTIAPVFSKNTVTALDSGSTIEMKKPKADKEIKKVNDNLEKLNNNLDKTVAKLNQTVEKLNEKSTELKTSVDQVSSNLKKQTTKKQPKAPRVKEENDQRSFLERTTGLNAPALGGVGLGAALGTALLPGIGTFIGGTIGGLAANKIASKGRNVTKPTEDMGDQKQPSSKLGTSALGASTDLKSSLDNLSTAVNNLSKKIIIPENKGPLSVAGGIEPGSETEKEKDRELLAQAIANKLGEVLQNNAGLGNGGGINIDLPGGGRRTPPSRKPPSGSGGFMEKLGKVFGALDIGGIAGTAGTVAGIGGVMALPWLGAIAEKKKIEEDPYAENLKDNPYVMTKRGEATTQGAAGAENTRKVMKSAGRQELQDVISSKMTEEEVQREYGTNREGLRNWLKDNPESNRYQIPQKSQPDSRVQSQSEQRVESTRVQVSNFSENEFSQKDPENYKKYIEYRDQEYKKALESIDPKSGTKRERSQIARTKATNSAREKFAKEIEAAGAGKMEVTESGNKVEPVQQPVSKVESVAPDTSTINVSDTNTPNVPATKVEPSNNKAGPEINKAGVDRAHANMDRIAARLQAQRTGSAGQQSKPEELPPKIETLDSNVQAPTPKISARENRALDQAAEIKRVAKELGLPANKVEGKFEGGKLTAIVHEGKEIDVSDRFSAEDKKQVDVARRLRSMNESGSRLQAESGTSMGADVSAASAENADLKQTNAPNVTVPIVSTNVNNNNSQQVVPIKAGSRNGSSTAERFLDDRRNF